MSPLLLHSKDTPNAIHEARNTEAEAQEEQDESSGEGSDDDTGNRTAAETTAALCDAFQAVSVCSHGGDEGYGGSRGRLAGGSKRRCSRCSRRCREGGASGLDTFRLDTLLRGRAADSPTRCFSQ